MPTGLFIILPAFGHLNPSFRIAKTLQNQGIRCVFVSTPDFRERIITEGFEYIQMASMPFGIGVEDGIDWKKKAPYIESLLDRIKDISYNARKADYERLMQLFNPDYIFVDVFFSTDFILLHQYLNRVKVFFVQTMLSTYNDGITPPLNSTAMPKQAKIAWIKANWKRKWMRTFDYFKFLGFSNLSIIKRKFKENQISEQYKINLNKVFHVGFENIPELVLAPKAFEFTDKPVKHKQYYVGSTVPIYTETVVGKKFERLFEQIKESKAKGKKIVYCSLGTIHLLHTKGKSEDFFKTVIQAFKQMTDYKVIMSVGIESKDAIKSNVSHIHIFQSVPQRAVLAEADLFITHGGLNSVQESILAETPMIVYPLNDKWDQNGNAMRVVYHRLGIKGKLKSETPKGLIHKVETLLNSQIYKENLYEMRKKISKSYSDKWLDELGIHTTFYTI